MRLQVTAFTHPGLVRETNEDAVAVGDWCAPGRMAAPEVRTLDLSNAAVCMVADGLGGQAGGEVASALAVARLSAKPSRLLIPATRDASIRDVHSEIVERMVADPGLVGMGTTLVGLVAHGASGLILNVGDSRAYRLEGGYLGQLSIDDSLREAGMEHVVTQSLGGGLHAPAPRSHVLPVELGVDDTYLLCSDGLTDYAQLDVIEDCLQGDDDFAAVASLIMAACEGGGGDNVSVLLIRVVGDFETSAGEDAGDGVRIGQEEGRE